MDSMTRPDDISQRLGAIFAEDNAVVWAGAGTGKTSVLTLRALYLMLAAGLDDRFALGDEAEALYLGKDRREIISAARKVIRSVALITFTRKAAAEMRSRLFDYLNSISTLSFDELSRRYSSHNPLLLEVVERIISLLSNRSSITNPEKESIFALVARAAGALSELAPELAVGTIHSFAARILSKNPMQARLPLGVRFSEEEDPLTAHVANLLTERWLDRQVMTDTTLTGHLTRVLARMDISELVDWLQTVFAFHWVVEELISWRDGLPSHLDGARLASVLFKATSSISPARSHHHIRRLQEIWMRTAEELHRGSRTAWLDLAVPAVLEWEAFFGKKSVEKAVKPLGPEIAGLVLDRRMLSQAIFYNVLKGPLEPIWHSFVHLLSSFETYSRKAAVQELGLLTFDDMIRMAADLLESNPSVLRREQRALKALLMDELQDTDQDQIRLISLLLGLDSPEPPPIRSFFVGDLKQSIYRFRKVDLGGIQGFISTLRDRWKDRVNEHELCANFRSTQSLMAFVNKGFEPIFNDEQAVQPPHQTLSAHRNEPGPNVEVVKVDPTEAGLAGSQANAWKLAAREACRRILAYLDEGSGGRFSDVMILVRTHKEVDVLMPELIEAGIPAVSSGTQTYFGNPEVLDLTSLLILLHHPEDTVAAAAVLRSPLVLISDEDLLRLREKDLLEVCFDPKKNADLGFLPPHARSRIEGFRRLGLLKETVELDIWLGALKELIPYRIYAADGDPEGRVLMRIQTLLSGFREVVAGGMAPPLPWLLKQRARAARHGAWDADLGEDVVVADESVDAVRVMTIHKAKGLEAPFVIVFDWAGILKRTETPTYKSDKDSIVSASFMQDGRLVQIRALRKRCMDLVVETNGFPRTRDQDLRQSQAEAGRLAYVAVTRARDRLCLIMPLTERTKLSEPGISLCGMGENGALSSMLSVQSAKFADQDAKERALATQPELSFGSDYRDRWASVRFQALEWGKETLMRTPTGSRYDEAEEPGPTQVAPHAPEAAEVPFVQESVRQEMVRHRGILVHDYLERFATEQVFEPDRLDLLIHHSVTGKLREKVREGAEGILAAFYAGELAGSDGVPYHRRILSGHVMGQEVPFYLFLDGNAWHGRADLILEEKGVIRIVDYKTRARAEVDSPRQLGLFDTASSMEYQGQKKFYVEALRRLYPGRRVAFEIFWLGLPPAAVQKTV